MPPPRFQNSKFLVYALFLSPALIALHACDDKNAVSPQIPDARAPRPGTNVAPPRSIVGNNSSRIPPSLPADPQAALESLTASTATSVRDHLRAHPGEWSNRLGPFYRVWGQLDPAAALDSADTEGPLAFAATIGTLEGWATLDPERARIWVDQQESATLRSRYAGPLIKAWPEDDLENLAAWSRHDPALLPPVIVKWAQADPQQAAGWLGALPDGEDLQRATESLFRQWAKSDPAAAGDYLIASPRVSNRDTAIAAYATTVVSDDPEAARDWAREIRNPDFRDRILKVLPSIRPLVDSPPESLSGTP